MVCGLSIERQCLASRSQAPKFALYTLCAAVSVLSTTVFVGFLFINFFRPSSESGGISSVTIIGLGAALILVDWSRRHSEAGHNSGAPRARESIPTKLRGS